MPGMNDYEVSVDVSIRNFVGGNIRLSEQVTIPDCTFEDMAEILHGFHQLASALAASKRKGEI